MNYSKWLQIQINKYTASKKQDVSTVLGPNINILCIFLEYQPVLSYAYVDTNDEYHTVIHNSLVKTFKILSEYLQPSKPGQNQHHASECYNFILH